MTTPAIVQQKEFVWTAGSTMVVTLPGSPVAGNALVMLFAVATTTPTVTGVSSTGATWVRAKQSNTNRGVDIWYAVNLTGTPGAVVTVTLSATGTTSTTCIVAEVSGVDPTSNAAALDVTGSNTAGTGTAVSTGTVTPIAGKPAIALAIMRPGGAVSAGPTNGYTALNNPDTRTRGAYKAIASTSGTESTAWTAGNGSWEAAIAILLGVSGGAASVTPGVGALTFTGYAPTVIVGTNVTPGTGTLALTGYAPSWATSGAVIVARTLTRTPIGQPTENNIGFKVLIPGNYSPSIKYPTITVYGGSGQRGTDNTSQMTDGLAARIVANPDAWQATFEPTIIIFIQWPSAGVGPYGGREWAYRTGDPAYAAVASEWSVDPRRRYEFGFSLGADVVLERIYESHGTIAGALVAEGSITNREGLLSGNDPAGTWTDAQAAAEVAGLTGALAIRHFNSTGDTNATVAASRVTSAAMSAAGVPNYAYSENAPVTGLTHVPAYTAVVNDDTQWAWLLDQWQPLVPQTGVLLFTGYAPSVQISANKNVAPGTGALSFTGYVPSISTTDNKNIQPGAAVLALSGYAPSVVASDHQTAAPGTGLISFTGFAPTVSVTAHQNVLPGTGVLSFVGYAPIVSVGDQKIVQVGTGALVLTGYAPTISFSDNKNVVPGTGALNFTGYAPSVFAGNVQTVFPGTGQLSFIGYAPTIEISDARNVAPGTGQLTFDGYAPTVEIVGTGVALTDTGLLVFTGYAPIVSGASPDGGEPFSGIVLVHAMMSGVPQISGAELSAVFTITPQ